MLCYKCNTNQVDQPDKACKDCCIRAYPSLKKSSFQSILERMKTTQLTTDNQLEVSVKEALF